MNASEFDQEIKAWLGDISICIIEIFFETSV